MIKFYNESIMNYRARKQLIIISISILILGLIIGGFYFLYFRAAPTCFDKIKNQGERDVDCGGPCASCERLTIRPPQVFPAQALALKNNAYDLVARIKNNNPNFGLAELDYNFKFYDAAGKLLGEKKNKTFLLPGKEKYIIEGNVAASAPIAKTELVLGNIAAGAWRQLDNNFALPNLFIQNMQFSLLENQTAAAQASGEIKNDSNFDFDNVEAAVVLMDADGNIIGVNRTEARTILAGEARYFSVSWFNDLPRVVAKFEMTAETNLLEQSNFMKRYGTVERFQGVQ